MMQAMTGPAEGGEVGAAPGRTRSRLRLVKMHGIGNDYLYADAVSDPMWERRADAGGAAWTALVRRMSDRHRGVGSDGVILVCSPKGAGAHGGAGGAGVAVRMRMFNADGSESEMCGNGVRCVAKFAHDRLGVRANPMLVETGRGVLAISWRAEQGRLVEATVDMGEPILEASRIPTTLPGPRVIDRPVSLNGMGVDGAMQMRCGIEARMTCVSMGNPHVVLFCKDVAALPLAEVGPVIERSPWFPSRVNAHFVQVVSGREVRMRTWERGAGATMACGTGACAVVVAGMLTGRLEKGVEVLCHLPGGDLRVSWSGVGGDGKPVVMTGPAEDVCEVEWTEP